MRARHPVIPSADRRRLREALRHEQRLTVQGQLRRAMLRRLLRSPWAGRLFEALGFLRAMGHRADELNAYSPGLMWMAVVYNVALVTYFVYQRAVSSACAVPVFSIDRAPCELIGFGLILVIAYMVWNVMALPVGAWLVWRARGMVRAAALAATRLWAVVARRVQRSAEFQILRELMAVLERLSGLAPPADVLLVLLAPRSRRPGVQPCAP